MLRMVTGDPFFVAHYGLGAWELLGSWAGVVTVLTQTSSGRPFSQGSTFEGPESHFSLDWCTCDPPPTCPHR